MRIRSKTSPSWQKNLVHLIRGERQLIPYRQFRKLISALFEIDVLIEARKARTEKNNIFRRRDLPGHF